MKFLKALVATFGGILFFSVFVIGQSLLFAYSVEFFGPSRKEYLFMAFCIPFYCAALIFAIARVPTDSIPVGQRFASGALAFVLAAGVTILIVRQHTVDVLFTGPFPPLVHMIGAAIYSFFLTVCWSVAEGIQGDSGSGGRILSGAQAGSYDDMRRRAYERESSPSQGQPDSSRPTVHRSSAPKSKLLMGVLALGFLLLVGAIIGRNVFKKERQQYTFWTSNYGIIFEKKYPEPKADSLLNIPLREGNYHVFHLAPRTENASLIGEEGSVQKGDELTEEGTYTFDPLAGKLNLATKLGVKRVLINTGMHGSDWEFNFPWSSEKFHGFQRIFEPSTRAVFETNDSRVFFEIDAEHSTLVNRNGNDSFDNYVGSYAAVKLPEGDVVEKGNFLCDATTGKLTLTPREGTEKVLIGTMEKHEVISHDTGNKYNFSSTWNYQFPWSSETYNSHTGSWYSPFEVLQD